MEQIIPEPHSVNPSCHRLSPGAEHPLSLSRLLSISQFAAIVDGLIRTCSDHEEVHHTSRQSWPSEILVRICQGPTQLLISFKSFAPHFARQATSQGEEVSEGSNQVEHLRSHLPHSLITSNKGTIAPSPSCGS
ncbi:hypothetical protein CABS01_05279 [Colletotrichum abscissum]|uniref:uncharacterized protein n=1 Tax=Colletotrichum abscissum TaxID=1671311 RepID=UPI0027D5D223|nr:uncharacterized protein CABS01_05279 [Colletotrichum abscissum]KAK1523658.1 hypothetical protein CABS01_05279 [Colletotrichum abscissum]